MVSENTVSALREQINYLLLNYPAKLHDFHFIVRMIYNSYANNMSASHCMHIKAFLSNENVPDLNLLYNLYSDCKIKLLPQEGTTNNKRQITKPFPEEN